jgi:hypothetical protein
MQAAGRIKHEVRDTQRRAHLAVAISDPAGDGGRGARAALEPHTHGLLMIQVAERNGQALAREKRGDVRGERAFAATAFSTYERNCMHGAKTTPQAIDLQ